MAKRKTDEPEPLPLDDEEGEPAPKAKRPRPRDEDAPEPKAGKKKPRAQDDPDEEPKPRRKPRPDASKVPYPPAPADVPDGLTDYAESYIKQQNRLLAGLFVFLMFYVGAVLFFALVAFWCAWSFDHIPLLKIIVGTLSAVFFLYLVKGFFKRHPIDKQMHIEITAKEHPVLFEFIEQLCEELDAPRPNKVFVAPDVNAAVMPRTSLLNLFVEPKKDLLIGLGLVNSVNLSEFKAVLAHEFGHFGQSATASSYTYVASRIIGDLVEGEDWFDRMVNWCKRQDNALSIIGYVIGGPLWVGRKILEQCYKIITLQRLAVSREREFHADLVAVSAAGSDAVVHCLLRTEFGHQCFMQALNDLATALDHKLHSNDLYLHQDRASAVVRRKKKEPTFGLPPALNGPRAGKGVEVFDADEEAMEEEIPEMWRTHPSNSDREKNAKEEFVPAAVDHRSPWLLFDDPAELKERMTYKFYRMVFKVPKNVELDDAVKVQRFIDNEHADTTYDAKYKGCYDDRPLEPGDLAELNTIVREKPWADERMEKVLEKLYDGCEEHADAHSELYKERQALENSVVGRPSPKLKRQIEAIEKKQDENWEWFKSFDRRVYLLHVQMADQVDKDLKGELVERYRFQLEVQRLYQESRAAFNKADAYLSAHAAAARGEINVGPEFVGEVLRVLRESWKSLKNIIRDAKEINLPAMKNFEEGENLADFILEGKMVPEPPLSYAKGAWINKLMLQLNGVRQKCFRLHFKSVGGILRMQEDIAAKWKAVREPVAAEVVDIEPVAAEVIPAEVVAAEVIPDEVVAAEVLEPEVIEAEVLPASPKPQAVVPAVVVAPSPKPSAAVQVPPPVPARGDEIVAVQTVTVTEVAAAAPAPAVEVPPAPPEPHGALTALAAFVGAPAPAPAPALHSPPVAPPPASEPTFDVSSLASVPTAPEPVAPEPVAPVLSLPDLNLDASAPKPALEVPPAVATVVAVTAPAAPAPAVPAQEIFSLDAGNDAPAAVVEPEIVAAEVVDVVDAVEVVENLPAEEVSPVVPAAPDLDKSKPEKAAAPNLSGISEPTGPKSGPKSGVQPAAGNRPRIKITFVAPGDRSPLAK